MLLFICPVLFAQTALHGKISVQTTDPGGKPLAFVNVLLRKAADSSLVKGELSNEQGRCSFEKIAAGQYFVQASLLGYATQKSAPFSIDAAHTSIALPKMQLPPLARDLEAVQVTAQKPFIERSGGKTILNVESSVTAAGNNALDLLRKAPGVTVDQNDNILVKGNQGVTVMIDGKLTYLSGEQLSNLLKSLPAETIAQIEIITTPEAKYDASGSSGIINIKTKKGQLTGTNGNFNASISSGRYMSYNAGGNFNWRTTRVNVFGNYNYADRKFFVDRDFRRRISTGTPLWFRQDITQPGNFLSNTYKAGIDYFLNRQHTIGVLVNGYENAFRNRVSSSTRIGDPSGQVDSILSTLTTNNNKFDNTAFNLNYKGTLDSSGKEITVDVDYARFSNNRRLNLSDSILDMRDEHYRNYNAIRNQGSTTITIKSAKADLTLPLNKLSRLETGVKASFVETDNELRYDSLRGKVYVPALSQSDRFVYKENILAAYATYKLQLPKTELSAGMRMENTNSEGYSVSMQSRVKRNYLNLFPSLSADHKFSDNHKLGISYSKRINRPGYGGLNPFLFFLDKYTYARGNPFLKPEYTHTSELSYTFKQKYIATAGFSHTSDIIMEFLEQNDETKITTSVNKNLNDRNNYSLNLTLPFDVTKWWNSNNTLNFNYNQFLIKDTSINIERSKLGFNFNTTNTFSLPHDVKIELTGFYNSPFIYGVFAGRAQYSIGIGAQKSLWNKKATIKVNVNDVTWGNYFYGTAQYKNIDMLIYNRWQSRTFNLSLSYRFGNSEIKGARERQTSTSEEARRAGN